MMSRQYQRPENALKRANEFIDVGKANRALEVLYEVIKRGKNRNNFSEKLLEPIMFKYLDLCVDLKKSHLAKEGLYQYRNIFQSVNVSSLETVVRHYLHLADERTEAARKESHQAVVDIDDLDNVVTPESILMSAVSGEDAQDRSDRTILTPWVKFLWESYRQCLELLRTNSRVERLYHEIAKQSFRFCEKYVRKTEFRKLCDNLRNHLSHIQKQQGSATAVNLNNPETQQMNLETRLEQLNYAIKMELWQEAYKAIEDISDLMTKSKKMPKPHMLASYYQKLAMVFWKAGNQLFHAAALFKLFQLLRDQKKNITPEELGKRASIVLVATLAIPLPSAHPEFDRFIETEKSALEKIDKLANLLSLPKHPTRVSLIRDLIRYNVVTSVPSELQQMYTLMEEEFDPLHVCMRMTGCIDWIQEHPELNLTTYVTALQEMTLTRLVKQVGQVYQTITFNRLLELGVFTTAFQLERLLVDLVRHNDLQIRIDHRAECVHFGVDLSESQREDLAEGPSLQTLPSETIRCQLVQMSMALQQCRMLILPESKKKEMEPLRAQMIQLYQQSKQRDHCRLLQRQQIIEDRKELLENQNLEREEGIRRAQEEQLKRQKDEETQRLEREAKQREKAREEEQLKQIHTKQIKDRLLQISQTSYGQKIMEKFDEEELLNLGAEEILQRQVEELEKERKEMQQRLKAQEKKVDYFERAKRLVEIPVLKGKFEKEKELDKKMWEIEEHERVSKMAKDNKSSLEQSQRLSRMHPERDVFLSTLHSTRRSDVEKKLNDFNARLEVERKARLAERKEQRRRERREAYYVKKAEDEQQRRDEEAKKEREERERIEKEAQEKEHEEYMEKKALLERQTELQKEKERLIEERLNEERMNKSRDLVKNDRFNRDFRDRESRDDRFSRADNRDTRDRREPDEGVWRRPTPAVASIPRENVQREGTQTSEEKKEESQEGGKPAAWRPGGGIGSWREKQRVRLDSWRPKDGGANGDEDLDGDELQMIKNHQVKDEESRHPSERIKREIEEVKQPEVQSRWCRGGMARDIRLDDKERDADGDGEMPRRETSDRYERSRDYGRRDDRDYGRREITRDSGRDMGRDSGRDMGRDSGRDMGRDSGRDMGRDSGRDMGRDSGRDMGRDSGRDMGRDSGRDMGRDSGRDMDRRGPPRDAPVDRHEGPPARRDEPSSWRSSTSSGTPREREWKRESRDEPRKSDSTNVEHHEINRDVAPVPLRNAWTQREEKAAPIRDDKFGPGPSRYRDDRPKSGRDDRTTPDQDRDRENRSGPARFHGDRSGSARDGDNRITSRREENIPPSLEDSRPEEAPRKRREETDDDGWTKVGTR